MLEIDAIMSVAFIMLSVFLQEGRPVPIRMVVELSFWVCV